MENLRVYILIKDPTTSQDVSIRGNMDILRAFLSGVSMPPVVGDPALEHPAAADKTQSGDEKDANTNTDTL